ncbi:hypothetical protein [Acholeplasma hippikon]|uniref:Uncharacterized protein n=1 Tax=Acholeplasma hippikon TaxID=264636 RepID=A0A449BIZ7_9MOLU|nr:hypothetical protein [Acholeplasma hippikon]VEU82434.1 Uncharacterised protein [Acholeplasma hippikon]
MKKLLVLFATVTILIATITVAYAEFQFTNRSENSKIRINIEDYHVTDMGELSIYQVTYYVDGNISATNEFIIPEPHHNDNYMVITVDHLRPDESLWPVNGYQQSWTNNFDTTELKDYFNIEITLLEAPYIVSNNLYRSTYKVSINWILEMIPQSVDSYYELIGKDFNINDELTLTLHLSGVE